MSVKDAWRVLGSVFLGVLMFFAGKNTAMSDIAKQNAEAVAKAKEAREKVGRLSPDEKREELKKWSKS